MFFVVRENELMSSWVEVNFLSMELDNCRFLILKVYPGNGAVMYFELLNRIYKVKLLMGV